MATNLNFFRGEYSKYLALETILDSNLYFTIPDPEGKRKEDDPKSGSFCVFLGEQLLASATHEADLKKVIGDVSSLTERINNISSELATYTMSAVTVADANVKEAYQLVKTVGETSEVVGETIKVYKDSALKEVKLVNNEDTSGDTQYLSFTYVLADGTESTVELDVSSFLVQSEFKNGLLVSDGGEVSVKLGAHVTNADGDVTSKNFLTFEGDVEGEMALAVRSMDTNKTVTTADIVLAGGPLDNQAVRKALSGGTDDAGNLVIKQGTNMQQLLVNLFTLKTFPTLTSQSYTKATASAAMNALTLTLSQKTGVNESGDATWSDLSNNAVIEVGTLVRLTNGSTNGSYVSSKTNSSITGLTYGWSAANDNKKDSSDTTITSTIKADTVNDNTYTVTATINSGFTADTTTNVKTIPTTVSGTGAASLAVTNLGCVNENSNKITINATGASYSYSAASITSGYVVSNVGETDASETYSGVSEVNSATTKPNTSANMTITAKYKYFMGGSQLQDPNSLDSDAIRGLTKKDWLTIDGTTTISTWQSPGYSVVIACPTKYKLNTITDSMGNSYLGKFSKTATKAVKTGEIDTNYTVYMYPLENNDKMDFKNITFKKA